LISFIHFDKESKKYTFELWRKIIIATDAFLSDKIPRDLRSETYRVSAASAIDKTQTCFTQAMNM